LNEHEDAPHQGRDVPQLTWLGDDDAKHAARRVPYRMLDPVEQVGDQVAGNQMCKGA
jgi:hypothetical protein